MTTIRLSDGIVKDEVIVVGLAFKAGKSAKLGSSTLQHHNHSLVKKARKWFGK